MVSIIQALVICPMHRILDIMQNKASNDFIQTVVAYSPKGILAKNIAMVILLFTAYGKHGLLKFIFTHR